MLEEMNGWEFQRFYDTGMMPERFWPEEIEKLKVRLIADEITLGEYEESLEAMMGFPA